MMISISDIQFVVSEHFGIAFNGMTSAQRCRQVARPRQVAMFLAREMTPHSYAVIGRHFGGRDHKTIMQGVTTIAQMLERDPEISQAVQSSRRVLKLYAENGLSWI